MNKKILETLEFNKVKALFEPHLLTEQGLEQLKELAPTDKGDKIRQAFVEMKEMQELFVEHPHFSISATSRNFSFSNVSSLPVVNCRIFMTILKMYV